MDYHDFSSENQKTISKQGSITVTNTGLDNISLTLDVIDLPVEYSSDDVIEDILAGETKTIPFIIKIPHEEGNGETTIGTLVVKKTATNEEIKRIPIVQETVSMLELTEIEVEYVNANSNKESEDLDTLTEDRFSLDEDIQVGSKISLTFKLRNLFDRDYDEDYSFMENIKLVVDADDSDIFPADFEEEYNIDDLDARDSIDITVTFNIEENADAGDYTLEFSLEGEDGKGAEYKMTKELDLDVNRKRDDVRITDAVLTPGTICPTQSTSLHVELQNLGTKDQPQAGLVIYNKDLGIDINIPDIDLDRFGRDKNSWDRTFKITLPAGAKTGIHYLDVRSFVNKDDLSQSEIVRLTLEKCNSNGVNTTENVDSESVIKSTTDKELDVKKTTESADNKVVRTVEDPYTTEDIIVAGLIVAMILVLAFIFLFIVMLIKG